MVSFKGTAIDHRDSGRSLRLTRDGQSNQSRSLATTKEQLTRRARPRILVVANVNSTFVKTDCDLLAELGTVRFLLYEGRKDLSSLCISVGWAQIVVCWFALGYATTATLLCRLLRKGSILMAGGWDIVTLPEIGYGAMMTPSRILKTKVALHAADTVLAFSGSSRGSVLEWVRRDVSVGYLGVDTTYFSPSGTPQSQVVTVAGVDSESRYRRKGLDLLFAVARLMPQIPFLVVGSNSPEWTRILRDVAPPNVRIRGRVSREDLRASYRESRVYAQLSAHEGFGVALAEAMACGCIPVVTDRGALPEVVSDAGYVVPYSDVGAARAAIGSALGEPNAGLRARKRADGSFSLMCRRKVLRDALDQLR